MTDPIEELRNHPKYKHRFDAADEAAGIKQPNGHAKPGKETPEEPKPEPSNETADESDDALVARLAGLSPLDYDRARQAEAERLGVRVSTLDEQVKKARGESPPSSDGKGQPLALPEPTPWPERVDGAAMLKEIADAIRRHVILPEEAATATALWIVFTYLLDHARVAPRLMIKSPEKRCGKSTLLELLTDLCCRALPASNISAAAVFRTIDAARPTLLLDEADSFMRENEELRNVLNSGHTPTLAFTIRTVEINGQHEPRRFSTWAAIALAGIGSLHGTIEDRSIIIALKRKLPGDKVVRLDPKSRQSLATITRKIARWTADHGRKLADADPDIPAELNDRAADNWRLLLAIADAAGSDWLAKAKAAARKLVGGSDAETLRVLLLADVREIAEAKGSNIDDPEARISSTMLCAELAKMEHRPWPEVSGGKPITTMKLANLLKPFGVAPHFDGQFRGYRLTAFADAWQRYLPPETPSEPLSRKKPSNGAGFDPSASRKEAAKTSGLGNGQNPHGSYVFSGLAAQNPLPGDDDGWEEV